MKELRSKESTHGRKMAGARALWRANGMKDSNFGKPIIAIANSFTQFVPGHVHLCDTGQMVKKVIENEGCFAAEFNTIAIDDGIAMGHNGMLYSLPSRELIADSIEYMCNAHKADALICITNCDKITPGMLMAIMRLNIPAIIVSGGPMEAGNISGKNHDLVDIMVAAGDNNTPDNLLDMLEREGCPTCGSCSGMFTANSMNCLSEALGLALPGNGTVLATHVMRSELIKRSAQVIVRNALKYYRSGDESLLPRSIASRSAFLNAMTLDIAMGGSTNTILHLLAIAREADVDFTLHDIDSLSREVPVLCKVAPNGNFHMQDVNRAGGVMRILGELARAGLVDKDVQRVDYATLSQALKENDINNGHLIPEAKLNYLSAPAGLKSVEMGSQKCYYPYLDRDAAFGCIRDASHAYMKEGGLAVLYGNIASCGAVVKSAGVDERLFRFRGRAVVYESQEEAAKGILSGEVKPGSVVVIRYEGPKGGPGMQEMLYPTSYLKSAGLSESCALITDGRFSGGSSGLSVGHISPEAAAGGEIALIESGDLIEINIPARTINAEITAEEMAKRKFEMENSGDKAYKPKARERFVSKSLKAYSMLVSSADTGAVRVIE